MPKSVVVFALALVSPLCLAQAPGFPSRDADLNVLPGFISPPAGYGQVPFWWWSGDPLDKERLLWQIEELHGKGITGMQVNYMHEDTPGWPTSPVEPEIFSEAWWDIWQFVAAESARRGMGIGLSGYTLDWPKSDNLFNRLIYTETEIQGREITADTVIRVTGSSPVSARVGPDAIAIWAYPVVEGLLRPGGQDLSEFVRDGILEWAGPGGEWDVRVFSAARIPGTLNPIHPLSGLRVIEKFFQPFEDRAANRSSEGLNYFFQDELHFGVGDMIWTDDLGEQFRRRKGYDLFEVLPALFSDMGPLTPKARLDFMDVFLKYFERLSYVLSQGVLQADIAVMYPVSPIQARMDGDESTRVAFDARRALFANGHDFIFMDDQSMDRAVVRDDRLEVSGMSFKVLILPSMKAIRWTTLQKALEFARKGGIVINIGDFPEASDRAGSEDPQLDAVVEALFGVAETETGSGGESDVRTGFLEGRGVSIDSVSRLHDEMARHVSKAVDCDPPVRSMHRRIGPRDVFFVMDAKADSWCAFKTRGHAEIWDPWTGEVRDLEHVIESEVGTRVLIRYDEAGRGHFVLQREGSPDIGERTPLSMTWYDLPGRIPLDVRSSETNPAGWYRFVAPPGLRGMTIRANGTIQVWVDGVLRVAELESPGLPNLYRVSLSAPILGRSVVAIRIEQERGDYGGAALPEPILLDCGVGVLEAGDWSVGSALETYSGGAWYRKTLTLSKEQVNGRGELDLGQVVATAEVHVNGRKAGVLVAPPWKVDVTGHLKAGQNRLEVLVYNTLANHYMTVPSRYKGASSRSGLLGPVRLITRPHAP